MLHWPSNTSSEFDCHSVFNRIVGVTVRGGVSHIICISRTILKIVTVIVFFRMLFEVGRVRGPDWHTYFESLY